MEPGRGPEAAKTAAAMLCLPGEDAAIFSDNDTAFGPRAFFRADGPVAAICDGELLNRDILRGALVRKGVAAEKATDAELVTLLYAEHGANFIRKTRGPISAALRDRAGAKLLLATDRMGAQPVYYSLKNGRLAFAGDPRALLKVSWISRDIDPAALELYLEFGFIPAPFTIHRDIRKLPPGGMLIFENGAVREERFWSIEETYGHGRADFEDALAMLRHQLADSAGIAAADGASHALLSGGFASALTAAAVARASNTPVNALHASFGGAEDEAAARRAEQTAKFYGMKFERVTLKADPAALLSAIAKESPEPFYSPRAARLHLLATEAASRSPLWLSGIGGGESFATHARYAVAAKLFPRGRLPKALARLAGIFSSAGKTELRAAGVYRNLIGILSARERAGILTEDFKNRAASPEELRNYVLESFAGKGSGGMANAMLSFDLNAALPSEMAAASCGPVRIRSPFLDHRMAELALSLPGDWKLPRGKKSAMILREAFHMYLPDSLLESPPEDYSAELIPFRTEAIGSLWRETMLSDETATRDIFSRTALSDILERHDKGENLDRVMMTLMTLEKWLAKKERTCA